MKKRCHRKVRPTLLPLGMKRLDLIEMPGHVALTALGQAWMNDSHYADLLTALYLGLDLSEPESDIHALSLQGIDLINNKSTDFNEMKNVIGTVVQWVATQPNKNIYQAVSKRLHVLDRLALEKAGV